ncbi:MscS Mechanosensitive ion channel [Halorubrum distributum JCM 9100]|uniref:MscS Mechanosensitive ion channel n=6 Tax=Halorubrum distributum TaxID=29283 RepID=M0EG83_9EURY|nr:MULTISPECIES: mechanosensitive ion channel family protein [Halorubrum distributum group]ELZ29987.1 MscS Mechanosensitive ion channel [Halorubrum terrestre JCM 10247]ELZ45419.1 MscS Mechanosensitive ion channel [Halorubrum distributum JCM 9100]ELZ56114.1 MscS Mechanosensitive ion channel [Halorubrum distributum JCM 10118]EMA57390.1 MscS Mechanosensitive ion channel [Halorubrum litoreum JCM 13561]EMA67376.1 MscS Mechanosensitive ion channel [Halorubrum arcis JCM 13916]
MAPLQFDAITNAVDVAALATTALRFVAGFLAVLLLGRLVLIPGLRRVVRSRGFDEAVLSLGTNVLNAVIWVAAIAIGFAVAGYGSFLSAFAVFGGAIALAVGFAAQDLLGNFVAGVFILKDKPFAVGDWIEWGGNSGRVEEIDLRVSRVRTFDNELVTVPNGDLANSAVTNPVAYDTLRQKFVFGIGYDDDIETATDIIVEKAEAHEEILDDPGVSVRLVELGDSAVGLQSRWWIADPDRGDFVRVRSEYVTAVKEAFDDAGIDMPYVHRQLTGSVEVIEDVAADE